MAPMKHALFMSTEKSSDTTNSSRPSTNDASRGSNQQQNKSKQQQSQQAQKSGTNKSVQTTYANKNSSKHNDGSDSTTVAAPVAPVAAPMSVEHRLAKVRELNDQVETLLQEEKYGDAEMPLVNCLHVLTGIGTGDHADAVSVLLHRTRRNLALVRHQLGAYNEAESLYRALIDTIAKSQSPTRQQQREHAAALANLCEVVFHQRKSAAAKSIYDDALRMFTSLNEPVLRASLMSNWASFLSMEQKYEEAQTVGNEALQLLTQHLGWDNEPVYSCMRNLAIVHHSLQRDVRDLEQRWRQQRAESITAFQQAAAQQALESEKVAVKSKKQEMLQSVPKELDPPGVLVENLLQRQQQAFEKLWASNNQQTSNTAKLPWKN